ncbi:uncharacterized protein LOC122458830 [Dermochelys coriacea]|uniref:uncharacterized protein LOC122458830 n=1 Tax=Dermochelys coriacea TaxID=27794 RepID=UPI001CA91FCC|nr:uncharacterized protein LOC122458830 [Dermochelys coriacea]
MQLPLGAHQSCAGSAEYVGKGSCIVPPPLQPQELRYLQAISHGLLEKGYKQDMQQCHAKIKELRQAYQKAREANHHSGPALKTCCFYKELDAILRSNPTCTATSPVNTSAALEAVDLTPRTKSWMRRSIWRMMWSTQQGCLVVQQVRNCFPHQRGLASPNSPSLTRIMQERRVLMWPSGQPLTHWLEYIPDKEATKAEQGGHFREVFQSSEAIGGRGGRIKEVERHPQGKI